MNAQHTPGPWRYEAPDEVSIKDASGGRVAILTNLRGALGMSGRRDPNEVIANARLCATAPDLLAVVRDFLDFMVLAELDDDEPHVLAAREVIAKATGHTQ